MSIYLCSVSNRFPENYQIGLHARTWGVEEKYKNRIALVMPGDTLVFLVGGAYRSIHRVESVPYEDHSPLWPEKDRDLFPHRIKISEPLLAGNVSAAKLADQISFMKGKTWGGTIQGASGVFNDRLIESDLKLIEAQMLPTARRPLKPEPIEVKKTSERQSALFKFYESDVEQRIISSLDSLGLRLYCDPETGREGRQYTIERGRIDLLCEDVTNGNFVVVELKKGEAPDETLLQLLRYMSWIRQNLAKGRDVKGIILTESADSVLPHVVFDVPNVSIRYYKINIDILPDSIGRQASRPTHTGGLQQKCLH